MLNYALYLKNKDHDSVIKQILLMSLDLHSTGKTSFYSNLIKMADSYGLNNFNIDVLDDTMIVQYINVMKQKYISC